MKLIKAFTLAEVLITLTVIGIVAAISLPALTTSINERAWDSQRKALHARLSQALSQINNLAGYGSYSESKDDEGNTVVTDTAAMTFITDGLSKVYKVKNTCDVKHLADCGISTSIYNMNNTSMSVPLELRNLGTNNVWFVEGLTATSTTSSRGGVNGKIAPAAIETGNGESILIYYNPYCGSTNTGSSKRVASMCVNFLYDLNGKQGPNMVGKDIGFITAFYKKDPVVVAPMPLKTNASGSAPFYSDNAGESASSLCKKQDPNSRIPDVEECASLALINARFSNATNIWCSGSGAFTKDANAYYANTDQGAISSSKNTDKHPVRCIKK